MAGTSLRSIVEAHRERVESGVNVRSTGKLPARAGQPVRLVAGEGEGVDAGTPYFVVGVHDPDDATVDRFVP